jgi:hypothetical protein
MDIMAKAIVQHDHQRGTSQRTILLRILIVDADAALQFAYRRLIEKGVIAVDTCVDPIYLLK